MAARAVQRQLRGREGIVSRRHSLGSCILGASFLEGAPILRLGSKLLVLLATVQIVLALVSTAWGLPQDPRVSGGTQLLIFLAFGGGGALLLLGGRADRRALYLGIALLLISAAYSLAFLGVMTRALAAPWSRLPEGLSRLRTAALFPLYLSCFAREFPTADRSSAVSRALTRALPLVTAAGALLAVAPLGFWLWPSPLWGTLERLSRNGAWIALALPALVWLPVKIRHADDTARRQGRFFLAALAVGFGPITLEIALEALFPAYHDFVNQPEVFAVYRPVLISLAISVPFATAYAVLVHGLLDVRLLARKALGYLFARYTTVALALAPFLGLLVYLYLHRAQTVAEIAGGSGVLVLLAISGLGALATAYRQRVLDALDRRFFRERYDARKLLTQLVEQIRGATHLAGLADQISSGVERAFRVHTVSLLVVDSDSGRWIDPLGFTTPLDPSSPLLGLLGASLDPLNLEARTSRHWVERLPETDRRWLVDQHLKLLLPLPASDGSLLGLIALGGKRSEFSYGAEDLELLTTIASSAALALEVRSLRLGYASATSLAEGQTPAPPAPALECPACGALYLAPNERCPACLQPLALANVPFVLPGRFRFEARLGIGGMGVVYRAVDLTLGRRVAVKTLRRLSPDDALRLRREARHAAAVSHPNLAAIHGFESWAGTPLLILEYLAGGTLRERLARGPFEPLETVDLGLAMAQALDRLHAAEILHRDVKPSNIGYDGAGNPKLMDFGIARTAWDLRADPAGPDEPSTTTGPLEMTRIHQHQNLTRTASQKLVGTLTYLPPEAFGEEDADAGFDLWSLSLVLYETLLGHPFHAETEVMDLIAAVRGREVPDLRLVRPHCPLVLAELFQRNLSLDRTRRAPTAAELSAELVQVRYKLMA